MRRRQSDSVSLSVKQQRTLLRASFHGAPGALEDLDELLNSE